MKKTDLFILEHTVFTQMKLDRHDILVTPPANRYHYNYIKMSVFCSELPNLSDLTLILGLSHTVGTLIHAQYKVLYNIEIYRQTLLYNTTVRLICSA